jgi:hypothetical protein
MGGETPSEDNVHLRSAILAVVAIAVGGACGGDKSTGPTTGVGDGNMSATINGVAWRSTKSGDRASRTNNFIAVVGLSVSNPLYTISLGIGTLSGPGTVNLDLTAGGNGSSAIVSNANGGWGTAFSGGKGTITVTSLSATRIVGTFSFDAPAGSGNATGVLQVRNGKFDVTF